MDIQKSEGTERWKIDLDYKGFHKGDKTKPEELKVKGQLELLHIPY